MQIHQIVIRPQENTVILLYIDQLERRYSTILDAASFHSAAAMVTECQGRLPSDADHPATGESQKEIADLEARVAQLKEAIGVP